MPRRELFDLAVERADTYLTRLLPGWELKKPSAQELAATIELWYLRTRFAYRVPLEDVVAVLLIKPPVEPYEAPTRPGEPPAVGGSAPSELAAEHRSMASTTLIWRGGPEGSWSSDPTGGGTSSSRTTAD